MGTYDRVSVVAIQQPVQNLMMHGVDGTCVLRIDCPNCGHQHLLYKPDGAGDAELYCYGEWLPIAIETII
jgi:hypothetical protein